MINISFISLFLAGLLGGSHCVGMCGSIVSALSIQSKKINNKLGILFSYNLGRIFIYSIIGLISGGIGTLISNNNQFQTIQFLLYLFSNIILILMGLYIAGLSQLVTNFEKIGAKLWQKLQPFAVKFIPIQTSKQALIVGLIWGWLPCGLVYSASISALGSGSAITGAGLMLAFGLGTLPNLLLMGWFAEQAKSLLQKKSARLIFGLIICVISLYNIIQFLLSHTIY